MVEEEWREEWRWAEVEEPLKIISSAAAATGRIADGRLLSVLLVDTSQRPDVEDLIRAHRYITPGDVKTIWANPTQKPNTVYLLLMFERPSKCNIILEFDILHQGGVVDQIVLNQAFYLQAAKEGERLPIPLGIDNILVEVPSKGFRPKWDEMVKTALEADGKRRGMSQKQAKEYAAGVIEEWRKVMGRRMKRNG